MKLKDSFKYIYPVGVFLLIGNGYKFDDLLWNGVFIFISSFILPIFFLIIPVEYLKEYHYYYDHETSKLSISELRAIANEASLVFKEKHPGLFLYNTLIKYIFWVIRLASIILIISGVIQKSS